MKDTPPPIGFGRWGYPQIFAGKKMIGREELLGLLEARGLTFAFEQHAQVLNMAESSKLNLSLDGARCKNLLLQDKQGQYYLVVTLSEKSLDLAATAKMLGSKRLSFASADRLFELLGVRPGSLSPLALVNDVDGSIRLVLDQDLVQEQIFLFHPLDSSATVALSKGDFMKFLESTGHKMVWTQLLARPAA